jgi:hypothetical protein
MLEALIIECGALGFLGWFKIMLLSLIGELIKS